MSTDHKHCCQPPRVVNFSIVRIGHGYVIHAPGHELRTCASAEQVIDEVRIILGDITLTL